MPPTASAKRPKLGEEGFDRLLFRACAIMGLFGCVAVIAADIAGILVVKGYDPVSHSISELAAGRYGGIQDTGLYFASAGTIACAIGLLRLNSDGWRWLSGCIGLLLIGAVVSIIAVFSGESAGKHPGVNIHQWSVYALGALIIVTPILLARGLSRAGPAWGWFSLIYGLCWLVLAPVYSVFPSAWIGAYERFLALVALGWLATVSWHLWVISGRDFRGDPSKAR
jgi:hypothetical protein